MDMRTETTEIQHEWDRRFAQRDVAWPDDPNATVVEVAAGLTPGHALDLAAGDGRNAEWLVDHGWAVTAVDISEVGLGRLRDRTMGLGHEVTTIHADLRTWRPHAQTADLVVLSFAHLPQPHRGDLHRAAAAAVRPGGRLVLVAHDRSNLEEGAGGPQDPALLPTTDELRDELAELELLRCEVVERPSGAAARPARDLVAVGVRRGA